MEGGWMDGGREGVERPTALQKGSRVDGRNDGRAWRGRGDDPRSLRADPSPIHFALLILVIFLLSASPFLLLLLLLHLLLLLP
eukprot:6252703-Pyramimonas_sp.AAC.1